MFDTSLFDAPSMLLLGAATGLVFGFLLEKGGVTRFEVIVGQFLLRDFTMLKVMLTAVIVGSVGIYAMLQVGMLEGLHLKPAQLLANAVGGLIFGTGMAILGYCPGTGVAAIGHGARDAVWGLLGMLAGAALYAETFPWIGARIVAAVDLGKVTLADLTGLSPWVFILGLAILGGVLFWWRERREAAPARSVGRTTGSPNWPEAT